MPAEVTQHAPRILIADDKASIRQLLHQAFVARRYDVVTASNGDQAISLIKEEAVDLVITDLKMPGKTGLDVLVEAKSRDADLPVIVVTAFGSIETAVEAMRLGAMDFISKPFQLAEIELKVDKALSAGKPAPGTAAPAGPRKASSSPERLLIGESQATKQLRKMIAKVGPSKSSVLITGPSGVGKELVARAVHVASDRRDKPFVALNCAALAPGVLESELFGHERGAFTGAVGQRIGRFEKAHTGTLFLDEVGDIDPHIQTKLLRVVQEGEIERVGGAQTMTVDVRIIAATNRDLRKAIAQGLFREDFYYRLNVFSLYVEPLCSRPDDIPPLVDHFLERFNRETGKQAGEIDDDVMNLFLRYPWPGNVRELENVMERAIVLAEGPSITMDEIPQEMLAREAHAAATQASAQERHTTPRHELGPASEGSTLIERTDQLESELIYGALQRFRWNKTKAAKHLGLKRTTLQYKIRKYGLE